MSSIWGSWWSQTCSNLHLPLRPPAAQSLGDILLHACSSLLGMSLGSGISSIPRSPLQLDFTFTASFSNLRGGVVSLSQLATYCLALGALTPAPISPSVLCLLCLQPATLYHVDDMTNFSLLLEMLPSLPLPSSPPPLSHINFSVETQGGWESSLLGISF